jgi:hypothetical protein
MEGGRDREEKKGRGKEGVRGREREEVRQGFCSVCSSNQLSVAAVGP